MDPETGVHTNRIESRFGGGGGGVEGEVLGCVGGCMGVFAFLTGGLLSSASYREVEATSWKGANDLHSSIYAHSPQLPRALPVEGVVQAAGQGDLRGAPQDHLHQAEGGGLGALPSQG